MLKKIIKKTFRLLLMPFILKDYYSFMKLDINSRFKNLLINAYPQIKDNTVTTGFDRHYVYHTSWAARKVKEIQPKFHVDISSSLYFGGILSAFIPVKFYDYRPASLELSNLESNKADLLKLPFEDNSISSLSCMHTIEHVGLGRYGDHIDPDADIKAVKELKRVLSNEGSLLFVVPIGENPIIEFNAHRIYTYEQVINLMEGLILKEFSFIPEKSGPMIMNAKDSDIKNEHYGCGCFWFKKFDHDNH